MEALSTLIASTAVLITVVGATQYAVLAFRNPFRSAWLRRKSTDNLAALSITASLSLSVGFEVMGLVAVGLPPLVALPLTPFIAGATIYTIWRAFDCRERLRRADAGLSPFDRQSSESGASATRVGV